MWSDFESFLQRSFGKIAPMNESFRDFEEMKQTTTVADYVSRMKTTVNKLKGSYLCPADGQVTVKFLRGLKSGISRLVENAAPDGWWK